MYYLSLDLVFQQAFGKCNLNAVVGSHLVPTTTVVHAILVQQMSYPDSNAFSSVVFPAGHELSLRISFIVFTITGVALTSYWLGRRSRAVKIPSWREFQSLHLASVLVVLLLSVSCTFFAFGGALVLGVGTSLNRAACSATMIGSIVFLSLGKGMIYLLLLEKVYIAWPSHGSRLSSNAYRAGLVSLLALSGMVVASALGQLSADLYWPRRELTFASGFSGRKSTLGVDRHCRVGADLRVTIAVLVTDLITTLFLSFMFLIPLIQYASVSKAIHYVARTGLIATVLCLVVSGLNAGALLILYNYEYAWAWLMYGSASIGFQSLIGVWITRPPPPFVLSTPPSAPIHHSSNHDEVRSRPLASRLEPRLPTRQSPTMVPEWVRAVDSVSPPPAMSTEFIEPESIIQSLPMRNGLSSSTAHPFGLSAVSFQSERTPSFTSSSQLPRRRVLSKAHQQPADSKTSNTVPTVFPHNTSLPTPISPTALFHPYYLQPLPPTPQERVDHASQRPLSPFSTSDPPVPITDSRIGGRITHQYHYRRRSASAGLHPMMPHIQRHSPPPLPEVSAQTLAITAAAISDKRVIDVIDVDSQPWDVQDRSKSSRQLQEDFHESTHEVDRVRNSITPTYIVYGVALGGSPTPSDNLENNAFARP